MSYAGIPQISYALRLLGGTLDEWGNFGRARRVAMPGPAGRGVTPNPWKDSSFDD